MILQDNRAHAGMHAVEWLATIGTSGEGHIHFVRSGLDREEIDLIRDAVERCQLTGNERFVDEVESALCRRIEQRGPGRSPVTK